MAMDQQAVFGITGQVMPWPAVIVPNGWALCDGSFLKIHEYESLFSVIGTTYGGDGQATFALPNLCGRVPLGATPANAPPPRTYKLGGADGTETQVLNVNHLPKHSHAVQAGGMSKINLTVEVSTDNAAVSNPTNSFLSQYASGIVTSPPPPNPPPLTPQNLYVAPAAATGSLGGVRGSLSSNAAIKVAPNGLSSPFSIMQESLILNFIICVNGIYSPPR